MSLVESVTNTTIGFFLAVAANFAVLPWFGFHVAWSQSLAIGGIMTGISIARSYVLRRAFEVNLYQAAVARLARRMMRIAGSRQPDFVIHHGLLTMPYLSRWWIIPRNRVLNIYLHHFRGDDEDRALHDHPWFNCSLLLQGAYYEHRIHKGGVHVRVAYHAGALKFRAPWSAHRVELIENPTWTIFITGPVMRSWGFHCPNGWRHWRDFVDERDKGAVGRGCS